MMLRIKEYEIGNFIDTIGDATLKETIIIIIDIKKSARDKDVFDQLKKIPKFKELSLEEIKRTISGLLQETIEPYIEDKILQRNKYGYLEAKGDSATYHLVDLKNRYKEAKMKKDFQDKKKKVFDDLKSLYFYISKHNIQHTKKGREKLSQLKNIYRMAKDFYDCKRLSDAKRELNKVRKVRFPQYY